MTRSEAIDMLRQICSYLTAGNPVWRTEPIREACEMAIEALTEKEHSAETTQTNAPNALNALDCVDTISRQAAIDAMSVLNDSICEQQAIDALCELPSAKPTAADCWGCKCPKMERSTERRGKWIYLDGLDAFECSVCGRQMVRNIFDYCPWCGAKMRGADDE